MKHVKAKGAKFTTPEGRTGSIARIKEQKALYYPSRVGTTKIVSLEVQPIQQTFV